MTVVAAWPLAIVGLALFFFGIKRFTSTWKSSALCGLLFGLITSAGGVWWFWDVIPLSWINVPEGALQWFVVFVVFSLTTLSLALPFALIAPLVRRIPYTTWYAPFALAFVFVAAEELRMWCFALFFLGPESVFAPDFSVAGLGYALTETFVLLPVGQLGSIGMNALVGLLAATLALLLYARKAYKPLFAGACASLLFIVGAHLTLPATSTSSTMRVALLATYFPPGPFNDPFTMIAMLRAAALNEPSVIATPEGLGLAPFLSDKQRQGLYHSFFPNSEGLIISSSVVRDAQNNERAELLYESSANGIVGRQDKKYFVPVGEYLPPLLRAALSLAGEDNLKGYSLYIEGTAVRGSTYSAASFNDMTIGALMCSELLSPRLYRTLATTQETDVLINIANNSWFNGSRLLHNRLKQVAKVHALRNRQPMLVSANGSPAYGISARGQMLGETAWDTTDILVLDIPR